MKTLTFFNNKGGVGKTTLTVNIASYLTSKLEKRVIVLDADPQANSTQMVIKQDEWENFYGEQAHRNTVRDMFVPIKLGERAINPSIDIIRGNEHEFHFDLIAGDPSLSIIEDILSSAWEEGKSGNAGGIRTTNWLNLLKKRFESEGYDYLIIDVGPSLGALNRSILLNSDYIITPMGSDIFSLMGIKNIADWIHEWRRVYLNGLSYCVALQQPQAIAQYQINNDLSKTTKLAGYSIQQYNSRKFKTGYRPVKAYDEIINQIPGVIYETLKFIIPSRLQEDNKLNLGDVPYLNSIIPMAQSNNTPLFNLNSTHGIRGAQSLNVEQYSHMLDNICQNLIRNISLSEEESGDTSD
ncbi:MULTISPECIES: ParA family protein [Bacillus cereus group]|uniref:ParA family protein n=1 Tax=Bacillus cereus group TaxID=86661 RepID=UPI000BF4545B|nr:ParA family protein [Bacillus cereus]PER79073.1 helicase DnaB [Bacillus cereus]